MITLFPRFFLLAFEAKFFISDILCLGKRRWCEKNTNRPKLYLFNYLDILRLVGLKNLRIIPIFRRIGLQGTLDRIGNPPKKGGGRSFFPLHFLSFLSLSDDFLICLLPFAAGFATFSVFL